MLKNLCVQIVLYNFKASFSLWCHGAVVVALCRTYERLLSFMAKRGEHIL